MVVDKTEVRDTVNQILNDEPEPGVEQTARLEQLRVFADVGDVVGG